jgi:phosphotransferase system HPr (HPr) family protein
MIHKQLMIQNKLGLHTRAAAKLVDLAKRFESQIDVTYRERKVDCKSIMGIITLGAQKDDVLDFEIAGNDETDAETAIEKLLKNKFGEE